MTSAPTPAESTATIDVAVIGGGPAGLQAALTIGRVRRRAVLFDSGEFRNATVAHMHNIIGADGTPPDAFRARARDELAGYSTVSIESVPVLTITPGPDGFVVHTAEGEWSARTVVLASGVRDELPAVPGLAEHWGGRVAQCPFCHGHEFTGQQIGILGSEAAMHYSAMLGPIADSLVVFADGPEPDADARQSWQAAAASAPNGLEVMDGTVLGVSPCPDDAGLVVVTEAGRRQVAALFVAPTLHQRGPFAEQLGLQLNPSGCVRIDEFGSTSVPGVFAAGDMAHLESFPMPMASVVNSMAMGQLAGAQAVVLMIRRDLGME